MVQLRFDHCSIWELYERNLEEAKNKLAELEVFSGFAPQFTGLGGWVFEQTIQFCLKEELKSLGISATFQEQISLGGRVKADLRIANLAIEIKAAGLFGMEDAQRYGGHKQAAERMGLEYLFFTRTECVRYRPGIINAVGDENVFFLEDERDWGRFVARIAAVLTNKK